MLRVARANRLHHAPLCLGPHVGGGHGHTDYIRAHQHIDDLAVNDAVLIDIIGDAHGATPKIGTLVPLKTFVKVLPVSSCAMAAMAVSRNRAWMT